MIRLLALLGFALLAVTLRPERWEAYRDGRFIGLVEGYPMRISVDPDLLTPAARYDFRHATTNGVACAVHLGTVHKADPKKDVVRLGTGERTVVIDFMETRCIYPRPRDWPDGGNINPGLRLYSRVPPWWRFWDQGSYAGIDWEGRRPKPWP